MFIRKKPEFRGRGGVYPLLQIGNSGLYARLKNFLKSKYENLL